MEAKKVRLDMAGRPLPDRTYPAETGSAGYTLHDRTLGQWLEYWAETTPDKEYIVYSDRNLRFTWSKFNERVDNLAKGLISIGVKRGSNVGIWATNVPDWLTFLYATAKIGAVLVTVNTNYKQNELEYLCKDSDMEVLCITDGTWDCNYVDMTYTMLPELKTCERGHLNSERFPYLKNVVYIGMEKYRGMFNTAELLLLGQNIEDETLLEMSDADALRYCQRRLLHGRKHGIHAGRQALRLCAPVPLLRRGAGHHELSDTWLYRGDGGEVRSVGGIGLYP